MNITTAPVDVEVAGHVYRVRPLTAGELVDLRKQVYAGSHPGRLKLAGLLAKEEPSGSELDRARWEASLPLADAEALAESRALNHRLTLDVYNRAVLAVDDSPCDGDGLARMVDTAGDDLSMVAVELTRIIQGAPEGKG